MPRDGSNVYSPDWVNAAPNTTIESSKVNAMVADFVADANAARPVTAGGMGATTAVGGADNLSTKGTAIASATTTDIGAATGRYVHITGTTTITGLGTKTAGVVRMLTFDGALTLTHNATSLILPGAANITTAAGDTAVFVSEGSGNWRCLAYQRAAASPARANVWETIYDNYLTTQASIDITNLSEFKALRLTGMAKPATDGQTLFLRTSTNNGSSYDAGASDYSVQLLRVSDTTVSGTNSLNTGMNLSPGTVGNSTEEMVTFDVVLENFNKATYPTLVGTSRLQGATNLPTTATLSARRESSTVRNAIRIIFDSGNISFINLTVTGVRG